MLEVMNTPQVLWKQYHEAVKKNNHVLAKSILEKIQKMKSQPIPQQGCGSCRRRF